MTCAASDGVNICQVVTILAFANNICDSVTNQEVSLKRNTGIGRSRSSRSVTIAIQLDAFSAETAYRGGSVESLRTTSIVGGS